MTPILMGIFVSFLALAESLYYWRGKQISSIRAQAREIIFDDPQEGLWNQIARFNSYGTWEDHFWSWRFSFKSFYGDLK